MIFLSSIVNLLRCTGCPWRGVFIACVFALACVSTTAPSKADGPASPEAAVAPVDQGAAVLGNETVPGKETVLGNDTDPVTHYGESSAAHTHDQVASTASSSAQPDTIYTCPMHPEVQAQKPGRCPKCGMNLEPVKVQGK